MRKPLARSVSSISLVLNLTQYGWRPVYPRTKLSNAKPSFHHLLHGKSAVERAAIFDWAIEFCLFCCYPRTAFLRRLIDLTRGVRSAKHFIRLKTRVKGDLRLWNSFLDDFNGRSFFPNDTWHDSHTLNLYTDATASLGVGAIFGPYWCYGSWPEHWKSLNIAVLEFYPIVLSVLLWGDLMRNQRIIFFTDNAAALVDVINRGWCADWCSLA